MLYSRVNTLDGIDLDSEIDSFSMNFFFSLLQIVLEILVSFLRRRDFCLYFYKFLDSFFFFLCNDATVVRFDKEILFKIFYFNRYKEIPFIRKF